MARSAESHLENLRMLTGDIVKTADALERKHVYLDRKMVEARKAGVSLRKIAAAVGLSDVAVLQRTRAKMPAKRS